MNDRYAIHCTKLATFEAYNEIKIDLDYGSESLAQLL